MRKKQQQCMIREVQRSRRQKMHVHIEKTGQYVHALELFKRL